MYNKLFTKILDSSVWLQRPGTRLVWICLLASMDETGFCPFSCAANVAGRARVSVKEAQKALEILEGPDPDSSDPENEGRRLERVEGGWVVLNAAKYRAIASRADAQSKTNERVKRFRERKRAGNASEMLCNASATRSNASETPSEAEAGSDTETSSPLPPASPGVSVAVDSVMQACNFTEKRLRPVLSAVIQQQADRGELPATIALNMIEAWKSYTSQGEKLRYKWRAQRFFAEGYWRDSESWPWDASVLREMQNANAGRFH